MFLVRGLFLFAVTLGGFVGVGAPRAPQVNHTFLIRAAALRLAHHAPVAVITWLDRQPGVSAGLGRDGQTVNLTFSDGTRGAVLPARLSTIRLPLKRSILHPLARPSAGTPRAVVLEPFATELGLGPTAGDPEVTQLRGAGFQVDQAYDNQVTVATMRNLYQYNLVYDQTHSGVNQSGDGVVATGELTTTQDPSIAPLIQDGSVIQVGVAGTDATYYGITSTFIRKYEGEFPTSSLVFLNGCTLLGASTFWHALQDKGVSTLVSWDKEATSMDNFLGAAAFFTQMRTGQSVADAIRTEIAGGFGKSTVNGTSTQMGFLGDGSLTLGRIAGGGTGIAPTSVPTVTSPSPAATPAATSTPIPTTPPTPTATPIPTATSVPAPPLQVTLRSTVRPGASQVVVAHTRPGVEVRFHVIFPNKDRRSSSIGANARGIARFTFKQHASKVTYASNVAKIRVQAGGSAVTTVIKRYRIDYSNDDVSVSPRRQASGKRATVYVHSRPGAAVALGLHYPSGQVQTFYGTTAADGWAAFTFTVPAGATRGSHRTGQAVSTVRIGRTTYNAITTFTIK